MTIQQLHTLFLQCTSACTDTRKIETNTLFFALKGANFNGNKFAKNAIDQGAKFAVIDEKEYASNNTILVENVLETLQKLATYHRHYLKIPIIALTGSNGKTTTKELINAVLSQSYKTTATIGNLNNHIGVPLTLLSMNKTTEIGIVEMGANHLKEIEFLCSLTDPNYGYITNFGKAHLEGFGSVQGVIKGKSELYNHLIANDATIFVNKNDAKQVELTKEADVFSFGTSASHIDINLVNADPFVVCSFNDTIISSHLIGTYNYNNISAAIAIGHYLNISTEAIKQGIENYIPENNRSQIVNKDNYTIILDAYNANPTSMEAALQNLSQQSSANKIAILGDMFELGETAETEHQTIADLAIQLNIDSILLLGDNFANVKASNTNVQKFKTFENFKNSRSLKIDKDTTILIKGSRGMALERVLELLE